MRILLLYLSGVFICPAAFAQYPPLDAWGAVAYSQHPDFFSVGSNLAALANIQSGGLAIAGQRRYGLPELDDY